MRNLVFATSHRIWVGCFFFIREVNYLAQISCYLLFQNSISSPPLFRASSLRLPFVSLKLPCFNYAIITTSDLLNFRLRRRLQPLNDRTNHFQRFPSILLTTAETDLRQSKISVSLKLWRFGSWRNQTKSWVFFFSTFDSLFCHHD